MKNNMAYSLTFHARQKIFPVLLAIIAVNLTACSGEGGGIQVLDVVESVGNAYVETVEQEALDELYPDVPEQTIAYVSLQTETPQTIPRPVGPVKPKITFSHQGSAYDTYYSDPPHWKIIAVNGYMEFTILGAYDFKFHALGSTIDGISYTYIDMYINDILYDSHRFIENEWKNYIIPSYDFNLLSYNNTLKIVLRGDTHLWIDAASIGNFHPDTFKGEFDDIQLDKSSVLINSTINLSTNSIISTINQNQIYKYSKHRQYKAYTDILEELVLTQILEDNLTYDKNGNVLREFSIYDSKYETCYLSIQNTSLSIDNTPVYDDAGLFKVFSNRIQLEPNSDDLYETSSSGEEVQFALSISDYVSSDSYIEFTVDCTDGFYETTHN